MAAPIVFFDIAGPDTGTLKDFYSAVFDWDIAADGRFSVEVASPVAATLRRDPAGKYLYLGVNDVTATLAKIEALGGVIDTPRFEVPGVVVLGLFSDPAGNKLGLVELEDGDLKVP